MIPESVTEDTNPTAKPATAAAANPKPYVALTVFYVALTVLYLALTVLHPALTVLYLAGAGARHRRHQPHRQARQRRCGKS